MPQRILVRATNWVGDAVMSLPALRAIRRRFPEAYIAVLAQPWVADLYARETAIDFVIRYVAGRWNTGRKLRAGSFDIAILFQNAFDAALLAWLGRIPRRIGYDRDARSWLLTDAIRVPKPGEIPPHQRFYYLELLRRAGLLDALPAEEAILLEGAAEARQYGMGSLRQAGFHGEVVGISPGAAHGGAKRWLPERFAEAAWRIRPTGVALFGSAAERELCEAVAESVRKRGGVARNFAGQTTLAEFVNMAAACRLFLTNDSGAMHIASALGVPTVAIFGPTDERATGPTSALARVVRYPVECSPCLLHECPIDHRCMTRVTIDKVAEAAFEVWTPEVKS